MILCLQIHEIICNHMTSWFLEVLRLPFWVATKQIHAAPMGTAPELAGADAVGILWRQVFEEWQRWSEVPPETEDKANERDIIRIWIIWIIWYILSHIPFIFNRSHTKPWSFKWIFTSWLGNLGPFHCGMKPRRWMSNLRRSWHRTLRTARWS